MSDLIAYSCEGRISLTNNRCDYCKRRVISRAHYNQQARECSKHIFCEHNIRYSERRQRFVHGNDYPCDQLDGTGTCACFIDGIDMCPICNKVKLDDHPECISEETCIYCNRSFEQVTGCKFPYCKDLYCACYEHVDCFATKLMCRGKDCCFHIVRCFCDENSRFNNPNCECNMLVNCSDILQM